MPTRVPSTTTGTPSTSTSTRVPSLRRRCALARTGRWLSARQVDRPAWAGGARGGLCAAGGRVPRLLGVLPGRGAGLLGGDEIVEVAADHFRLAIAVQREERGIAGDDVVAGGGRGGGGGGVGGPRAVELGAGGG